ncbi:FUSC family protein [Sanguibacter sp. A247]|uniref:FUSC family protein n=1 Tax=unclassified Sanguibacter TaxID=2645534 RepID=UPI003FD794BF
MTTPARTVRRRVVQLRVLQGRARVRRAFVPVLQAAVASSIAYAIAFYVLGHELPFFAPISAWVCLGFSADRELRRVAELGVGVALGVGFGDLVAHGIGSGWWQIGLTLFAAALLARFLDRGQMLTMQAGVQAVVIIGMPQMGAGPVGRWTDALVGGATALLIATLTPGDPRRHARVLGAEATTALAEMLRELAAGLRTHDSERLQSALDRGRGTQGLLEDWATSARSGLNNTKLDAASRRYREDFRTLVEQAELLDRAVRSVRVLARRSLAVPSNARVDELAELVGQAARATQVLAAVVGAGSDATPARAALTEVAALADPGAAGDAGWQVQSLVVLMRSPLVDLLEAAGASPQAARDALPDL